MLQPPSKQRPPSGWLRCCIHTRHHLHPRSCIPWSSSTHWIRATVNVMVIPSIPFTICSIAESIANTLNTVGITGIGGIDGVRRIRSCSCWWGIGGDNNCHDTMPWCKELNDEINSDFRNLRECHFLKRRCAVSTKWKYPPQILPAAG